MKRAMLKKLAKKIMKVWVQNSIWHSTYFPRIITQSFSKRKRYCLLEFQIAVIQFLPFFEFTLAYERDHILKFIQQFNLSMINKKADSEN